MTIPHPRIVSRDDWLRDRKSLLVSEKKLTKQYDEVCASRRRLPMVELDKRYTFDGPYGRAELGDPRADRRSAVKPK